MLVLRVAVLIVLLLGGRVFPAQENSNEAGESYAVYAVLVPDIQSLPQSKYLIANETIPYTQTKSRFPIEPENVVTKEEFDRKLQIWKGTPTGKKLWSSQPCVLVPETKREAYVSAMVDYLRKNDNSTSLERRFDLPKPYELLDFSKVAGDKKLDFAKQNGADGLYELSAVGFNSDMTAAIVYVGFHCLSCTRKAIHILEKTNGKWQEVDRGCACAS